MRRALTAVCLCWILWEYTDHSTTDVSFSEPGWRWREMDTSPSRLNCEHMRLAEERNDRNTSKPVRRMVCLPPTARPPK
jgi:hypothetical protein